MARIAPSFLAADIWNCAEQVASIEAVGCEFLHLDIMDGCFVPNISFGPDYVKMLRPHSKMFFDVHLMVSEPAYLFNDFAAAGADLITVHVEACRHIHRSLQQIKDLGLKAGVALNPATPLAMVEEIINNADLILLMSVNPGFCGQSFIAATLDKCCRLRGIAPDLVIEVDGGINAGNAADIVAAGADLLVAGSAVFAAADCAASYKKISDAAANSKNKSNKLACWKR